MSEIGVVNFTLSLLVTNDYMNLKNKIKYYIAGNFRGENIFVVFRGLNKTTNILPTNF